MKANGLMIEDWVKWKDDGECYRISEISAEIKVEATVCFVGHNYMVPLDEINPIPLTPEILEKNGWRHEFDKTDYMVKYNLGEEGKNCWMMWAVKEHNLDIQRQDENLDMYNLKVSKVVIPCNYVHQLQHAMRICGIEKTIEL